MFLLTTQVSWPGMVLVFAFFVLVRTCGRTNVMRNQRVMLKGNSLHKANPHSSTPQTCFLAFSQVGELTFGTCPSPGTTLHHRFLIGAAGARLEPRGPEGQRPYPNPSLAWLLAAAFFWPKKQSYATNSCSPHRVGGPPAKEATNNFNFGFPTTSFNQQDKCTNHG